MNHEMSDEEYEHSEGASFGDGKRIKRQEGSESKTPAIDTFGRDITRLASEGELDPVIGR